MDEVEKQIEDLKSYTCKLAEGVDDIENWISEIDDPDAQKEMNKRFAEHRHVCDETVRLLEGLEDRVKEPEMTEEKVWEWLSDNPKSFTDIEVPEDVWTALWRDRVIDMNEVNALTLGELFKLLTEAS